MSTTRYRPGKRCSSSSPGGRKAFTAASVTIDGIGVAREINESGNYDAVKPKLASMNQKTQAREMRKYGAAPDAVLGSAHAVTETGTLLVPSLTGSQLPAYAYGAGSVIWVIRGQKIVQDVEEGLEAYQRACASPGKRGERGRPTASPGGLQQLPFKDPASSTGKSSPAGSRSCWWSEALGL
ncbi:MAG: lactate utilization protein [Candidatus Moduliflexus flocculans]|nr:lactate utilization protein [Candidatus Moduliflexus flocculans]